MADSDEANPFRKPNRLERPFRPSCTTVLPRRFVALAPALERWSVGALERWSVGALERWSVGASERRSSKAWPRFTLRRSDAPHAQARARVTEKRSAHQT